MGCEAGRSAGFCGDGTSFEAGTFSVSDAGFVGAVDYGVFTVDGSGFGA